MTGAGPIRVVIDRLVLHGVSHADAAAVQRALQAELGRRLAEGGIPASGFGGGRLDIASAQDPAALGRQAGAALGRSLLAGPGSAAGAVAAAAGGAARRFPPPATISAVAPGVQRRPIGEGEWAPEDEDEAEAEAESLQAPAGPGPGQSLRRLRRKQRRLRRNRRRLRRRNKSLLRQQALHELKGTLSGVSVEDLADEAKRIVELEAAADDYDTAYERLKSDPKMWALYRPEEKNSEDTYVYLPSYLASQTVDLSLGFDIPIAVADDASSATTSLGYSPLNAVQLLALAGVDSATQGRVLRAVNSTNATVAVSAQVVFVTQTGAGTSTVTPVQTLNIRDLNDSRANLLRSVRARRLPPSIRNPGGAGSTESFQLVGTLTVSGRESRLMILLPVPKGTDKKKAIKDNFK